MGKKADEERISMRKRRRGSRSGGSTSTTPERYLYLVLDDWFLGYSIRKIGLSIGDDEQTCLPLPSAMFQVEAQRELPMYFAVAFGSNIIAMHPKHDMKDGDKQHAIAFDVREKALSYGPRPNEDLPDPIFIPVRDKLFALGGSFQRLDPPPQDEPEGSWAWHKLDHPPFDTRYVTSYAVHPDGTIYVSIGGFLDDATYSFDVSENKDETSVVWDYKGQWLLPFMGRVHYNHALNAWVGFSGDPTRFGSLCACDVASFDPVSCPEGKLSKENLLTEDPAEFHIGATLVYMEGRDKFCIVECICVECNVQEDPTKRRYLFRVTTFSLKYDENGET